MEGSGFRVQGCVGRVYSLEGSEFSRFSFLQAFGGGGEGGRAALGFSGVHEVCCGFGRIFGFAFLEFRKTWGVDSMVSGLRDL